MINLRSQVKRFSIYVQSPSESSVLIKKNKKLQPSPHLAAPNRPRFRLLFRVGLPACPSISRPPHLPVFTALLPQVDSGLRKGLGGVSSFPQVNPGSRSLFAVSFLASELLILPFGTLSPFLDRLGSRSFFVCPFFLVDLSCQNSLFAFWLGSPKKYSHD